MDPVVPQDEYFEWEDVMAYYTVGEDKLDENILLQPGSLASCSSSPNSADPFSLPAFQCVESRTTSMATPRTLQSLRSTLTLDTNFIENKSSPAPSPINFPSYAEFADKGSTFLNERFPAENLEISQETMDDMSLCPEPSRHVDYLSHDWKEDDVWESWRRLASKRKAHKLANRLENASWRAWTKVRLNLKPVTPESFNWMKDLDDTWLYGPFYSTISSTAFTANYPHDTHSSKSTFTTTKTRSILKRRRLSEVLLRGSSQLRPARSKSVELESKPFFGDTVKKRVVFREEVEQYAAVQTSHVEPDEFKDELDHWTETYQSKFEYGDMSDPIEDLLSTTQSLRHQVKQNLGIIENLRQPKTVVPLPSAPLKRPNDFGGETAKKWSSPTRRNYESERPRFSTLSEFTMLGNVNEEEEEDWLEPGAYTVWKPTIPSSPPEADFASQFPLPPTSTPDSKLQDVNKSVPDNEQQTHGESLKALMRREQLYLDPTPPCPTSAFSDPSSSSSEATNSATSSTTSEDGNDQDIEDAQDHDFQSHAETAAPEAMSRESSIQELKQAFVDCVMEDFYRTEMNADDGQDFSELCPSGLRLGVMGVPSPA